MRKIEREMIAAIKSGKAWKNSNTSISMHLDARGFLSPNIFLHGNHIATVENGVLKVNAYTLGKWPTPTTKSRLRALGANVATKAGVTYLNGARVEGGTA
tara:strand:+ start:326 stop:625 length:300 start_codon:yes stop_codon:yes gene_type:complete